MIDSALMQLGIGGALTIGVLKVVLDFLAKRRNGNGYDLRDQLSRLDLTLATINATLARLETCMEVIKDRLKGGST
jgi:hypothetical protein